jgi:hypothetical protein
VQTQKAKKSCNVLLDYNLTIHDDCASCVHTRTKDAAKKVGNACKMKIVLVSTK